MFVKNLSSILADFGFMDGPDNRSRAASKRRLRFLRRKVSANGPLRPLADVNAHVRLSISRQAS
jgi:hypothetical protein